MRIFTVLIGLFLAFCLLPTRSFASSWQDEISSGVTETETIQRKSPPGSIYQVEEQKSKLTVSFRYYPSMTHIDFRLLAFPEFQKELNLSDRQLERLQPVFEGVYECDVVWMWELACQCAIAREQAAKSLEDLKSRLANRDFLKTVLSGEQVDRLAQLEYRFALFSIHSMGNWEGMLLEPLELDTKQRRRISEVVTEALDRLNASNKAWEMDVLSKKLHAYLGNERYDVLSKISGDRWFSSEPLIRFAQMSPFYSYDEVEHFKNNQVSQFLINEGSDFLLVDPVILPTGRMSSSSDFAPKSSLAFQFTKWQKLLLSLIRDKGQGWLTLLDSQVDALNSLYVTEEPIKGAISYRFAGPEHPKIQPEATVNLSAYRNYIEQVIEWQRKIDQNIENTIKSVLSPHQLTQLQFSLGASRFNKLGVQIILSEELLGDEFVLEESDLVELKQLVADRKKAELQELQKIEGLVVNELSTKQRQVFLELFGEKTDLFPPFVTHWCGDSFSR